MKVRKGIKRSNSELNVEISDEIISDIENLLRKIRSGKCCIESVSLDIKYDEDITDRLISDIQSGKEIPLSNNDIDLVLRSFVENDKRMTYDFIINLRNILTSNTSDRSEVEVLSSLDYINDTLTDIGSKYKIRQETTEEMLRGYDEYTLRYSLVDPTICYIVYEDNK